MSERSLSPASRSQGKDSSLSFRDHKEVDDHCDIEKEEFNDSESEELPPDEVSKCSILSPSKFRSPKKSLCETSPKGSPTLKQRKNLDRGRSPEIKSEKQKTQETIEFEYDEYYKRMEILNSSGSSSRGSSLTRRGIRDRQKTSPDHNDLNNVRCSSHYIEQTEHKRVVFKKGSSTFSYSSIIGIISGMVTAIAIFSLIIWMVGRNSSPRQDGIPEATFAISWIKLQKSFKNQPQRFWTITGSATMSIVSEVEPRDPAVILLVVPKEATASGRCFLRKYEAAVAGLFDQKESEVVHFNSLVYRDVRADRVKMKLDGDLEKGFEEGKKVAVIEHLESLAAETAMIFYRFCDNEQAPYKRVAIVLTLHLAEDELSEENDKFVEEKLAALWEPIMGEDKFRPLMSRIANSVAFLRAESPETLAEIGC